MDALRQFCATQKAFIPTSYEEIIFSMGPRTHFYLTPKSGVLHFKFFKDGKEIKLLTDLYHIGFPKKNQLQVYKNVLQYYWSIIQEESKAVEELVDQDDFDCYYTNFNAFDQDCKKETLVKRKNRIMEEIKKIDFEKLGIKFTKSKIMTDGFKWHVYVKFHSTYWMLRIRDSNSKRIDILMPNIIHHTCYFIQHFLQQLITK
jgi:hypothetical protein